MASKLNKIEKKSKSNNKCGCCNDDVALDSGLITCSVCNTPFHKTCVSFNNAFNNRTWQCPLCLNKKPKGGDNTNTPVRSAHSNTLSQVYTEDVQNIIVRRKDVSSGSQNAPKNTTSYNDNIDVNPALIKCIGDMLDNKLEVFTTMISEFKASLKEDIKSRVIHEVNQAAEKLKADFTSTTDYLKENQNDLKLKIQEKDREIEDLRNQTQKLEHDIRLFSKRLSDMDRQTRSLNLELQSFPERNNENVVLLFKKMCECIGYGISDMDINACRRVAKLNPKSKRPRNILVSLSSIRHRDAIISALHRYNKANKDNTLNSTDLGIPGERTPIYVSEHLPPECKEIHAASRKFAKDKGYKFVWVKYGRVYLRKDVNSGAVLVKSVDMLQKL